MTNPATIQSRSLDSGGDDLLQLNEQLRHRVAELQALFELAPVGLAIARDVECRRVDPNPAFRRMLRLGLEANASCTAPPEERPTFRIVRDDGVEIPREDLPMQVAARTGVPINGSLCHVVFENGEFMHLLGSSTPLFDDDNKPRGCIGAFLEITEHIQLAQDLRDAGQAAENATRAKDLFLATLSHELRTPLNVIELLLHLLKGNAALQSLELQSDLRTMQGSVDMLVRLIDDLLDVQRIVTGKLTLTRCPLDFHALASETIESRQLAATAKGLTLTFRPEAPAHQIHGDAGRLRQVIGNVVNNAIKFTRAGRIDIATSNVDTNCEGQAGRFVRVTVTDTGVGFSGSPVLLFRHFEQGSENTTQRFGGLGLGLAICKGFVEGHDGAIAAASEGSDRGTIITIDLPLI